MTSASLMIAIRKLAMAGAQAGFTVEQNDRFVQVWTRCRVSSWANYLATRRAAISIAFFHSTLIGACLGALRKPSKDKLRKIGT